MVKLLKNNMLLVGVLFLVVLAIIVFVIFRSKKSDSFTMEKLGESEDRDPDHEDPSYPVCVEGIRDTCLK